MNKTKRIVICGMIVAISFVLDYFSIKLPLLKISLYALPLIINGILFGPLYGLLAGLVEGLLAQVFSQYGLQITAPLWMIAPILWGVSGGLLYKLFNKMNKYIRIILTVLITSLLITLINTCVLYLDGIIWNYPVELTYLSILTRFGTSLLTSIIYSIVLILVIFPLQKFINKRTITKK